MYKKDFSVKYFSTQNFLNCRLKINIFSATQLYKNSAQHSTSFFFQLRVHSYNYDYSFRVSLLL